MLYCDDEKFKAWAEKMIGLIDGKSTQTDEFKYTVIGAAKEIDEALKLWTKNDYNMIAWAGDDAKKCYQDMQVVLDALNKWFNQLGKLADMWFTDIKNSLYKLGQANTGVDTSEMVATTSYSDFNWTMPSELNATKTTYNFVVLKDIFDKLSSARVKLDGAVEEMIKHLNKIATKEETAAPEEGVDIFEGSLAHNVKNSLIQNITLNKGAILPPLTTLFQNINTAMVNAQSVVESLKSNADASATAAADTETK